MKKNKLVNRNSGILSKTLDHQELVAGIYQEIGISQLIGQYLSDSADQIVSTGKALEAMVLNGFFVNNRLYLIPLFFRDKPIALLLGPGIGVKCPLPPES